MNKNKKMMNKQSKNLFQHLFTGGAKETDIFTEERSQTPGKTILKNFLHNKTAIGGLLVFLFITLFCFIYTALYPVDVTYQDVTQTNLAPGYSMMKLPGALTGSSVMDIDAGSGYSIGIDEDGNPYQWGVLPDRMETIPDNITDLVQVSAGYNHALGVTSEGRVVTWGNNRMGLGVIPLELQNATNVKQVEAGYQYSMAVTEDGKLYFWGNPNIVSINTSEYSGITEKVVTNTLTAIIITTDGRVSSLATVDLPFSRIPESIQGKTVDIATTDAVAAAVLEDGTVIVWGRITDEAMNVPEEIQGHVTAISAGRAHFIVLLDDGTVAGWGQNNYGQIRIPGNVKNIVNISAGYHQNYAVDADGNVYTWGLKGYLMGTDQYGRDMFTRLLEGGKMTMTIGAIAVIISTLIGILIGGISGYFGGRIDNLLMRLAEIINAIPFLPLAMILSSLVAGSMSQTARIAMIMVILGLLSWPSLARLCRAQILAEREKEYVTAAKAMGVKEIVIVFRHIVPNIITTILVNVTLAFATCMLTESTLSFLGFGVSEPMPSWGNMLTATTSSDVIGNYWWRWVFPALALSICSISINFVGDGLREAIDPKSNER